jgi:hypothetical protein
MSFDKFLLAVESHDLSQDDKGIIRVSCFPKVNFITQKFARLKSKHFSQFFLVRGKSERIESIHFAKSSGLSC